MKQPRLFPWLRTLFAASVLAAGTLPAWADVYGYIDEAGTAHFSSDKVDDRYELYFRGNESFDTAGGVEKPGSRPAVPVAAPPKLISFIESSPSYKHIKQHLRDAASTHGVDYELLQALIAAESGFNTRAVSPKGAIGLMQIMPATAERYGVVGDKKTPAEKKLVDPKVNIKTGVRYLRYLLNLFPGRLELALAAYNAGEGAVQRAGNKIPNYPETQNYVKTVMQMYGVLKPPVPVAPPRNPNRIRVEMGGPPADGALPMGGAFHRGNMPQGPSRPSSPSEPSRASQGFSSVAPVPVASARTERADTVAQE